MPLSVLIFGHDFVQEDTHTPTVNKTPSTKKDDHVKLESGTTRWNAKQHTVAYDEGKPRQLQEAVVLSDAISDLPPITSHEEREEIPYEKPPETEFQKYTRLSKDGLAVELNGLAVKGETDAVLTDHRTYKLSEDDFNRVCYVPRRKGANFRDFPGLIVTSDNLVKRDPKVEQVLLPSGKALVNEFICRLLLERTKKLYIHIVITVRALVVINPDYEYYQKEV